MSYADEELTMEKLKSSLFHRVGLLQTLKRTTTPDNRSVQTVLRSVHRSNRSVQTVQRSTGVVVHFRVCKFLSGT